MTAIVVYFVIGLTVLVFLAMGVGRIESRATLFDREIPAWAEVGPVCIAAVLLWPVVIWLAFAGRPGKAPPEAQQ